MNKIIACNPKILEEYKSGKYECKSLSANVKDTIPPGTAIFPITGILTYEKTDNPNSTSYLDIINFCESIKDNANVDTVIFYVNSPGGYMDGVSGAGTAIDDLTRTKTVIALVDGLCCSGAYWLACNCSRIVSANTSEIGSIGVYTCFVDDSEFYKSQGINFKYIKSGEFKAIGTDNITDAQLAIVQENVNDFHLEFLETVQKMRLLDDDKMNVIKTGRTFAPKRALKNGLIDEITNQPITNILKSLKIEQKENKNMKKILEEVVTIDEKSEIIESETVIEEVKTDVETIENVETVIMEEETKVETTENEPVKSEIESMKTEISTLTETVQLLIKELNKKKNDSPIIDNVLVSDECGKDETDNTLKTKILEYAKKNKISVYKASKVFEK